uniref:Uncharacterized protein n=1 Tax=Sus scrofa TaxID=9823 RepID=A0A8D1D824_PIG
MNLGPMPLAHVTETPFSFFTFQVHVGGNSYVHIKVFKSLPYQNKPLELSGYQVDKTKDDELTGF